MLVNRLGGYINFTYRSLKSARDGRQLEQRLDATESVPWLLDVMFALVGRVRPYNKYLPWELREHPLNAPEWAASRFLPLLDSLITDGHDDTLRRIYAVVERECRGHDLIHGTCLGAEINDWGDNLRLLRSDRS